MADIAKMIEEIKSMTVLELNDLVKAIEEEFGVSAAAPVAVVAGPAADAAPVEEKTEFKVTLKEVRAKKIDVIKYKSKKNEKKKIGHRQDYTKIQIEKIEG